MESSNTNTFANNPQLNGVGPSGDRRPYFMGTDTFGNPQYEWYSAQGDETADDFEAAEMANIYDWNKSMYNNWYNSPSQQLSRLREAGLNPNFFMANQQAIPAQGATGANAPNVKHANNKMNNILGAMANALGFQKQVMEYKIADKANSINQYRAETDRKLANAQISDLQSQQDYRDFYLAPKALREIAQIDATINNLVKDGVIKDEQAKNLSAQTDNFVKMQQVYDSEIAKNYSTVQVNRALTKFYGSMENYYDKIATPMANELQERAGMEHNQALKLSKEAVEAGIRGDMLGFQRYLLKKYGEQKTIVEINEIIMRGMEEGAHAIKDVTNTVFNPTGVGNGSGGRKTTTTVKKGANDGETISETISMPYENSDFNNY